ncbi:MAG: DUF2007 domain-containing protein [Verrucomicrobiales bacterium]|nr:DUF2007 domain-containing protein [Verrucomicrobiales bacterium]
MKKVYEHIDFTKVGYYQSILESNDITTSVRNVGAGVAVGEIPFHEIYPELWVVHDEDFERAEEIIAAAKVDAEKQADAKGLEDWTCPDCGEAVEKEFSECWNCGTTRPGFQVVS